MIKIFGRFAERTNVIYFVRLHTEMTLFVLQNYQNFLSSRFETWLTIKKVLWCFHQTDKDASHM